MKGTKGTGMVLNQNKASSEGEGGFSCSWNSFRQA